jgi:hypothetical protein
MEMNAAAVRLVSVTRSNPRRDVKVVPPVRDSYCRFREERLAMEKRFIDRMIDSMRVGA